ncbi:hypothetical protein CVT24_011998 [Panaeolus cyanescens]|uniref:Uncharacterized protein n=1 Tax=Panaeolus cyanescens TaxID=181874 RepID=A0A409VHR8_9AGAR|nr:hypothetical protein CVT24_011998 [Panaeolus cyanescens]
MATRRRIGISAASTEAARRHMMQPVPCWEKVWVTPAGLASGPSSLKVYKWVKTDKIQQFSDDEGDADEPLAPLPDEPELVDGDEDEPEEVKADSTQPKEVIEDTNPDEPPSKVPSPKPELRLPQPEDTDNDSGDMLKQLDTNMDDLDDDKQDDLELNISGLGPDGLQLEGAHDLSQLDGTDGLIGGSLMDESTDPFADTS